MNKEDKWKIVKYSIIGLIVVAALVVAYLFALNKRYEAHGSRYYDKWRKEYIEPPRRY